MDLVENSGGGGGGCSDHLEQNAISVTVRNKNKKYIQKFKIL